MDHEAARRFLATAYDKTDWIALFVKSTSTDRVAQRVIPASFAMSSTIQAWLAREDAAGANVFVTVNALRPTTTRRRADVRFVRHVFVDADRQGPTVLAAIAQRPEIPTPSYVLQTSRDRFHVFWRVHGFDLDLVELVQRQLAVELGTDTAATSAAQLTRLAGSHNHKYASKDVVQVKYVDPERRYRRADFCLSRASVTIARPAYRARTSATGSTLIRARRYVAASGPAISGAGGDVRTFRLCCRLVRGFDLSDEDALVLLNEWNARCEPPWREQQLRAKLRHARRYGREPIGGLLRDQP